MESVPVWYKSIPETIQVIKGEIVVKKRRLLITSLIISLVFGAYNFISVKETERKANELFKYSLYSAQGSFNKSYSKMNENDKIFNFMKASSDLNVALVILESTSYANIENHEELSSAISELYRYTIDLDTVSNRWEDVDKKSQLILRYLHFLGMNPNDKNSSDALFNLANNLRLGVENVVINYEATSLNWDIDYKIDGTEYKHDTYYTFRYIGKDADVKDVNYSIDSSNEGEDDKFEIDKTKIYTGKLKLTAGLPKPTDRDITFKIKWNGKEELLILKRSK